MSSPPVVPPPDSTPEHTKAATVLAVIAIAIGYVLNPLNSSLVVTAYPRLAEAFDVPYAYMSAMVMYFMAATAVAQPLAGGLGDLLGRRNIFLIGIVGFLVASGLAGSSSSYDELLQWRMLQAVFSGVIMANGVALLSQVVPKEKLGSYLGVLTAAVVTSTSLGFPLGGLIQANFDWHALFWVNIPIGILALVLATFFIPKDKPSKAQFTAFSFMGLPFLPLAFAFQALVRGESVILYGISFVLTLALLVFAIRRSKKSRAQFKAVGNTTFTLASLLSFCASAIQFGMFFMFPAWMSAALGLDGAHLGIYLSILSVSMLLVSPIGGRILDAARGPSLVKVIATIAFIASMSMFIFVLNQWTFAIALMLLGVGMAMVQLLSQWAALLAVPRESQGLANGVYNSLRSVGSLSGNALTALVLGSLGPMTAASGVTVLHWHVVVFLLPLLSAMFFLQTKIEADSKQCND